MKNFLFNKSYPLLLSIALLTHCTMVFVDNSNSLLPDRFDPNPDQSHDYIDPSLGTGAIVVPNSLVISPDPTTSSSPFYIDDLELSFQIDYPSEIKRYDIRTPNQSVGRNVFDSSVTTHTITAYPTNSGAYQNNTVHNNYKITLNIYPADGNIITTNVTYKIDIISPHGFLVLPPMPTTETEWNNAVVTYKNPKTGNTFINLKITSPLGGTYTFVAGDIAKDEFEIPLRSIQPWTGKLASLNLVMEGNNPEFYTIKKTYTLK